MDLTLPPARLTPTIPLVAVVERKLTPADLDLAAAPKGTTPPNVIKLRDRHHALARAIANGVSQNEAAVVAGYSPSRVSILLSDPSFKELVEHYRGQKNEQYRDFHSQLAHLASTASDELLDRLEDEPEKFDNEALLKIVTVTADRTGYGPQSKNLNVNVNVDLAERLARARKQARMIDAAE